MSQLMSPVLTESLLKQLKYLLFNDAFGMPLPPAWT